MSKRSKCQGKGREDYFTSSSESEEEIIPVRRQKIQVVESDSDVDDESSPPKEEVLKYIEKYPQEDESDDDGAVENDTPVLGPEVGDDGDDVEVESIHEIIDRPEESGPESDDDVSIPEEWFNSEQEEEFMMFDESEVQEAGGTLDLEYSLSGEEGEAPKPSVSHSPVPGSSKVDLDNDLDESSSSTDSSESSFESDDDFKPATRSEQSNESDSADEEERPTSSVDKATDKSSEVVGKTKIELPKRVSIQKSIHYEEKDGKFYCLKGKTKNGSKCKVVKSKCDQIRSHCRFCWGDPEENSLISRLAKARRKKLFAEDLTVDGYVKKGKTREGPSWADTMATFAEERRKEAEAKANAGEIVLPTKSVVENQHYFNRDGTFHCMNQNKNETNVPCDVTKPNRSDMRSHCMYCFEDLRIIATTCVRLRRLKKKGLVAEDVTPGGYSKDLTPRERTAIEKANATRKKKRAEISGKSGQVASSDQAPGSSKKTPIILPKRPSCFLGTHFQVEDGVYSCLNPNCKGNLTDIAKSIYNNMRNHAMQCWPELRQKFLIWRRLLDAKNNGRYMEELDEDGYSTRGPGLPSDAKDTNRPPYPKAVKDVHYSDDGAMYYCKNQGCSNKCDSVKKINRHCLYCWPDLKLMVQEYYAWRRKHGYQIVKDSGLSVRIPHSTGESKTIVERFCRMNEICGPPVSDDSQKSSQGIESEGGRKIELFFKYKTLKITFFTYTFYFLPKESLTIGPLPCLKKLSKQNAIVKCYAGKATSIEGKAIYQAFRHSAYSRPTGGTVRDLARRENLAVWELRVQHETRKAIEMHEAQTQLMGVISNTRKPLKEGISYELINVNTENKIIRQMSDKEIHDCWVLGTSRHPLICPDFLNGKCDVQHNQIAQRTFYYKTHPEPSSFMLVDFKEEHYIRPTPKP